MSKRSLTATLVCVALVALGYNLERLGSYLTNVVSAITNVVSNPS